jgi:hypothetical protein
MKRAVPLLSVLLLAASNVVLESGSTMNIRQFSGTPAAPPRQ